jgi:Family of unknown function (DUF6788)
MTTTPEELRRRITLRVASQRALVQSLLGQREQLQGSLFARYGECGKETCACRQGRKHGPYYVLSVGSGGKGAFEYLEGQRLKEARGLVARYKTFRRGLRRLRAINLEVVDLLRRYQTAATRRAGQRLGMMRRGQRRNI